MEAHGEITEIFPDIYYVMGTNITTYNNVELQHSRNMIIVRDQDKLSLINTVKLSEQGLSELEALGKVENIIRLGSFHGRDDAFYLERYDAKLWALKGMQHDKNRVADHLLEDGLMPFSDCTLFNFVRSKQPEGILYLAKDGGILITCDSIKNWMSADPYFSESSAKIYQAQGYFGAATISKVWKDACGIKGRDFEELTTMKFRHLLSAHGEPLLDDAYEAVTNSILQA